MIELTKPGSQDIFTKEALAFVEELQRQFNPRREELLQKRAERYQQLAKGAQFDFLPETAKVRSGDWKVAPTPKDLQKRHTPSSSAVFQNP